MLHVLFKINTECKSWIMRINTDQLSLVVPHIGPVLGQTLDLCITLTYLMFGVNVVLMVLLMTLLVDHIAIS